MLSFETAQQDDYNLWCILPQSSHPNTEVCAYSPAILRELGVLVLTFA